jgi:hypothetical protein
MRRGFPSKRVAGGILLVLAATAVIAAVTSVACLVAPPADLPALPTLPPTIVRASVVPQASIPLLEWPDGGQFFVPVQVNSPGVPFYWSVFVDYFDTNSVARPYGIVAGPPDGGTVVVPFTPQIPPTSTCPHVIQFMVAHQFIDMQLRVPDSVGGDEVDWYYTQGGGPSGCPLLDAGSGAFPEASPDGPPIFPEAGPLPDGGDS